MRPDAPQVNRIDVSVSTALVVVRGEQSRAVARQQAKQLVKRQQHDLVLHATSEGVEGPHAQWYYDLRRKRLTIWGGMLRFVDALVAKGYTERAVQIIPEILREYIAEQFRGGGPDGGSSSRTTRAA